MMQFQQDLAYVKNKKNDSFNYHNYQAEHSQDSTQESEQFSLYGGLLHQQSKNSYKQMENKPNPNRTQIQQCFSSRENDNDNNQRLKGYKYRQKPQQQQQAVYQNQYQYQQQNHLQQRQQIYQQQNYFPQNDRKYKDQVNYYSPYVKMILSFMEALCYFQLQESIDQYQENRNILLKMRTKDNQVHIKINAETSNHCDKIKKEIKQQIINNKLFEFPFEIENLYDDINEFLGFIQKSLADRIDPIDMKRQFYIYSKDEILGQADILDQKFQTQLKQFILYNSEYKQSIFYRCNSKDDDIIKQLIKSILEVYKQPQIVPPPVGIKSYLQQEEMKEEKIVRVIKDHKTSSHQDGFQVHFYNTNDERLENIKFEVEDFYSYLRQNLNDPITIVPAYGQQRLYFQIEIPQEVNMHQIKANLISLLDGYINYSFNYVVNYQNVNKSELQRLSQLENCSIDIVRVNTSFRGLTQSSYSQSDCGFGLMFRVRNLIYSKLKNNYFINQLHSIITDKTFLQTDQSFLQTDIDDSPQVKLLTKHQINKLEQTGQEFYIIKQEQTLSPESYWVALGGEWKEIEDDEDEDLLNLKIEFKNSRFNLYPIEHGQDQKLYLKKLKSKRQSLQLTLQQLDLLKHLFKEVVFYIPIPIGMDSKHLEDFIAGERFDKQVNQIVNFKSLQKGRYLIGRGFGPIQNNEQINLQKEVDWNRQR